ncbi:MAG: tetratricopeptide repeat protein [Gemmataceae bacterium]
MTRRGRGIAAVSILLALGAAWLWWSRSAGDAAIPPPPEIPAEVVDDDVRQALTAACERVRSEPHSGAAWGELGLTFRAHNLNPESNACFAVAAKLDPQNPRWPYLIGVINLLIEPDNALPHLRIALQLATDAGQQSAIRTRLAEALLARNETLAAASLLAEEVRINPRNPRARLGLGAVAAARGDHAAAVTAFQAAVDSPFARKKASALLANSHRRLGNTAAAEEE